MSTNVFTAASTQVLTATAMAATTMAAPTALGHRRLSAQIYQRAERNGHCKYFDKVACHRRTPPRKGNLRQSIEFHKQTFSIALAMSALGQKRTWRIYSITSSARDNTAGGIVRPSALAVLRLMISSNLVGC
jgi:hypothetical protein